MSRIIDISDETYERIKMQLLDDEKINIAFYDDLIGKNFFRIVTYHFVGKVTKRFGDFLVLECASWIADSGRKCVHLIIDWIESRQAFVCRECGKEIEFIREDKP